jgi:uncharacterized protein
MDRFMFLLQLCRKGYANDFSVEPAGMHEGHPLALTEKDIEGINKEHEAIACFYVERLNNGEFIPFFVFNRILRQLVAPFRRLYACEAGNSYITINPDGEIYACQKEGPTFIGSIEDGFDAELRGRWHRNSFLCKDSCRSCWARYICGGECGYDAIEYSGDATIPYWASCALRQHWIKLCIWVMSELNERGRQSLKNGFHLRGTKKPEPASIAGI